MYEIIIVTGDASSGGSGAEGDGFISNSRNKVEKWELHTSTTSSDNHLNVLLPSKKKSKHTWCSKFSHSLNVVPNLQIPEFLSPRKEDLPPPLPPPQGLWTRWAPYGVGGSATCKPPPSGVAPVVTGSDFTVLPTASPKKRVAVTPRKTHGELHEEERQQQQLEQQQELQHLQPMETIDEMPSVETNEEEGPEKKKKRKKNEEVDTRTVDSSATTTTTITDPAEKKKKHLRTVIQSSHCC